MVESTTILQASRRGSFCCDSKEVQLSQRLTDSDEAGLRQLATDCRRVFRYSFVAFWQRVCRCVYYFGDLADVIQLYNQLYKVDHSKI